MRNQIKRDPMHFHGYTRISFMAKNPTAMRLFNITPVGLGKITNLREKGEVIYGHSFEKNPLFRFFVKMVALYTAMIQTDQKKIQHTLKMEFTENLEPKKPIFSVIESVIADIVKQGNIEKYKNKSRVEKLLQFQKMMDLEAKNTLKFTTNYIIQNYNDLSIPKDHQNLLVYEKYFEQHINALRNIEPLIVDQQDTKLKSFQTKHKEWFSAEIATKQNFDYSKKVELHVCQFSQNSDPILQRLSQFMDLRFDSTSYKSQSASFIKDLYRLLTKYEKIVTKSNNRERVMFMDLNPQSIVIDQLKLQPFLHYEPALLDAIGLRNSPYSTECRISFAPTPKGIQYFRSPVELKHRTQLILRDPMYGCYQLYPKRQEKKKSQAQKSEENIEARVKEQKRQLNQIKGQMAVWRFLLVAYFIIHNKQFGRLSNPLSNFQAENHFCNALKKKEAQIRKDSKMLQQFLGMPNQMQRCKFTGKFDDIGDYMQVDNDDSMIKAYNWIRISKYSEVRWSLVDEIVSFFTIKDPVLFGKFPNVKKYIIMYLTITNQMFQQSLRFIQYETDRAGERKKLKQIIDKSIINKLQEILTATNERIQGYLKRDKQDKDVGARYLTNRQEFIIKLIRAIYQQYLKLKEYNNSLDKFENNPNVNERPLYKQNLSLLKKHIEENLPKIRRFLIQMIYVELQVRSTQQILHKLPDKDTSTLDYWKLVTRKFILLAFTYLSLTDSKLPMYESLVISPLLNIMGRGPDKQHLTSFRVAKTDDDATWQRNQLNIIDQIIQYKNIIPKYLYFLDSKQVKFQQAFQKAPKQ